METKTGRARNFGVKLKGLLKQARQLWRDQRAGKASNFQVRAERIEEKITDHFRQRSLKDEDNQRLLDGIGLQNDRGNLLRFLHEPNVEPTNNRAERRIPSSVIVLGLSQCAFNSCADGSKNERGAEAYAAFASVVQTAVKTESFPRSTIYSICFARNHETAPSNRDSGYSDNLKLPRGMPDLRIVAPGMLPLINYKRGSYPSRCGRPELLHRRHRVTGFQS